MVLFSTIALYGIPLKWISFKFSIPANVLSEKASKLVNDAGNVNEVTAVPSRILSPND